MLFNSDIFEIQDSNDRTLLRLTLGAGFTGLGDDSDINLVIRIPFIADNGIKARISGALFGIACVTVLYDNVGV